MNTPRPVKWGEMEGDHVATGWCLPDPFPPRLVVDNAAFQLSAVSLSSTLIQHLHESPKDPRIEEKAKASIGGRDA